MATSRKNLDDFFEEVFGYRPAKTGRGFELLVAAAIKIAKKHAKVRSDVYQRGEASDTVYQLDALVAEEVGKNMVEAKDYTERGKPVGRGDLQKLAGALIDLDCDGGTVASATGFTKPATKYSAATQSAALSAKPIDLMHVRPSVEADEQGRVRTIIIRFGIYTPDYDNAKWTPALTADGTACLKGLYQIGEQIELKVTRFVRADGSALATIPELTASKLDLDWESARAVGEWTFEEAAFIEVEQALVGVTRISYDVPYHIAKEEIRIEATGTPRVLIRSESGDLDQLLTDDQLAKIRFGPGDEVHYDDED